MLGIGDGFFIETSAQATSRILHPAKILGTKDDGYTAEIEEANVSLADGAEFFIYFEVKGKFVKQAAKIEAVYDDKPNSTIEFITAGEPVSAENRQHFRVSTVMLDLTATLGEQADCKLLNVSAIGFSVLATAHYGRGATVDASVCHEGETYSGRVCIQGSRPMDNDQIRYGLHCVDSNGSDGTLEDGLRQMTMDIQRKQLRRLSNTA
ncbi:MAG: hypothetical protein IH989_01340 [Planctomycetes bacterium]|nr:hypothetical protein [Planctomycetota bacterium]